MNTDLGASDRLSVALTEPGIEQISRFQSLQSGQYWRSLRAIAAEGIDEGTVLLIQSIRCVDDSPHTIILRPHPAMIGKDVYLPILQDDGSTQRVRFHYDEHRFLLNDFLNAFEFEPDHQRVRGDEVRKIQGRINELQNELLEAQSDPALLAGVVEAGLREHATKDAGEQEGASSPQSALPAGVDAPGNELVSMAGGTIASAIGTGITVEGIASLKKAAGREHQIATIKSQWIQGKTTEIAQTIKAMTPFYEEQAAAALAHTEDVQAYVAKLLQGIESLDLYVGKDVEVLTIRTGESASNDVPLTFVQRKLMMDEELSVWADIDQWFDFQKEDLFFEALRQHDALVDQIFPTGRCVLVMATTRRYINYGDKWANVSRNDENRKVFLLVRDGMNIHRVFSPVESHLGTARLFPSKDDQDRLFRGFDGNKIKFEDVAYTDKLAAHEEFALHYKRFLLLVCGLDHRLKLFGDFYEGPQSLNFVSIAFQEQHCRFLHDDDGSGLLPGEQRQSLAEWIAEKNTYLRSGSRVLCNWNELMNPDTAPGACKESRDREYGRGFGRRYAPKERMGVAIAYRDGDSVCVDVEVSGHSYSARGDRTFNCKVYLSRLKASSWGHMDLPCLCLDAVRPEELNWYIQHRDTRRKHLSYIRCFKQALKFIGQELAGEQDTRQRLAQALADGDIADPPERDSIVGQAVIAWRAANRGKPLPQFDGNAAPAWKSLLDQMYMLAGEGKRRIAEIENFVQEIGLVPLRLVMTGGAKLVVYAAPKPDERDDRLEPHAWVHRLTVERGKTRVCERNRRWSSLPQQAASETTLHQWEGAEDWSTRVSAFPSFERKVQVMAEVSRFRDVLRPFMAVMSEVEHDLQVEDWRRVRTAILAKSRYVENPAMAVPFGVIYYPRSKELRLLCVGSYSAHTLLARLGPCEAARERVRSAFLKPFKHKDSARLNFEKQLAKESAWTLMDATQSLADNRLGVYVQNDVGVRDLSGQTYSPLLADWFDNWSMANKDHARVWLADGALDVHGRLAIDTLLGIKLPQDYEPVRLRWFSLTGSGGTLPKYHKWIDLCPGAKAPGAGGSSWPRIEDPELRLIVDSVASEGNGGYSSSYQFFLSRSKARDSIAEMVNGSFGAQYRAVPVSDLADAPLPPEGIERWYVVHHPALAPESQHA